MFADVVKSYIRTRNKDGVIEEVLIGGKGRISECHDFVWSRSLWKNQSKKIALEATLLSALYFGVAIYICIVDKINGVDLPYFLASTLTTVGLGDVSLSTQGTRLAAVAMLPLGLLAIGLVLLNIQAFRMGNSKSAREKNKRAKNDDSLPLVGEKLIDDLEKLFSDKDRSLLFYKTIFMLRDYILIIFVGAIFFRINPVEQKLQKRVYGRALTWVDCFYFATVTSTSVGYGVIVPLSRGAKIFCTFYFLIATTIVGKFIGDFAGLHGHLGRAEIYAKIINSTVWIHKADLHHTGFIFQSDYVLFKLRQMQAVDETWISQLASRFHEIDRDRSGLLTVGVDVPSAAQVRMLEALVAGTTKSLEQAWKEHRAVEDQSTPRASFHRTRTFDPDGNKRVTKLLDCHDFEWSRSLYEVAWVNTAKLILKCTVAYFFVGYLTMAYFETSIGDRDWLKLEGWYFMSATLSTVGFGDFAPRLWVSRFFSIFMIPSGLIIVSLALSAYGQYKLARALKPGRDFHTNRVADAHLLFDELDTNGKCFLSKDQVIENAYRLNRTEKEAAEMFNYFDINHDGIMLKSELGEVQHKHKPSSPISARCTKHAATYVATIATAALFFKFYKPESDENHLTWIDAFYLATVVATAIGYGNVVPESRGGRLFLSFYFLVSTIIVGAVLNDLKQMYYVDIAGAEVNAKIIESTIHLHHMAIPDPKDPEKYSQLTEADFVLFKMMQMQKVDEEIVERLIDRFFDISRSGTRSLVVGVDIPNRDQVKELEELTSGTGMTLQQAWEKKMAGKWSTKKNPLFDLRVSRREHSYHTPTRGTSLDGQDEKFDQGSLDSGLESTSVDI